jgi:hypothetical protein
LKKKLSKASSNPLTQASLKGFADKAGKKAVKKLFESKEFQSFMRRQVSDTRKKKQKAELPQVIEVDLLKEVDKVMLPPSSLTVKMATASRTAEDARLICSTNKMADVWWNNGGAPGFALGTNGQWPIRDTLSQLAAMGKYANEVDHDALDDLAELIALTTLLLVEVRMDATKLAYNKKLDRNDGIASIAEMLAPRTTATILEYRSLLLAKDGMPGSGVFIPKLALELASILSTPIQVWGCAPGSNYNCCYWLPVGCKSLTAATLLTLITNIMDKSLWSTGLRQIGFEMDKKTGKFPLEAGHFLGEEDIKTPRPVSLYSSFGFLMANSCPCSAKSAGGVVSYQTDDFKAAQDIFFSQQFGMDGIWDFGVILGTTHGARTNDIWESITCVDPANNSDIGVARTVGIGATSFTVCTLTSTFLDWIQAVATIRSVYYRYDSRHPFFHYLEDPLSEAAWNINCTNQCKAVLLGKRIVVKSNPLLPEIVSVSDFQETVLQTSKKSASKPFEDYRVADPTVGTSMSAGGAVDGKSGPGCIEQITAGEAWGSSREPINSSSQPRMPGGKK